MYIIFLKFGPNRAQAGQWMAEHVQWIQRGIDSGNFLMAGSLDNAQGGVVMAANMDRAEIEHQIGLDPFVIHNVVTADIQAVAPSRLAPGFAAVLDHAKASLTVM
ncbi:MAG: hypothetical protein U5M53_05890 [Rhodoferax sp.]|nr:hypothetical protein [Rhodoferax sp.]